MDNAQSYPELLREKERAMAGVCGAAQIAVWFFEAQNFAEAQVQLESALAGYNRACRALLDFHQSTNQLVPTKENLDGNRSAA